MRQLKSEKEIMKPWEGNLYQPFVSICCITYNHEKSIEYTLEGFLIQQTSFPFEILIHDDASKDRTALIIQKYESMYPDLIKPIYQNANQHSQGRKPNIEFNYPRAKGKYIALCEGDDYWTDPFKLQKQVDFLETHPGYGMTYSMVRVYNQEKGQFTSTFGGQYEKFEEFLTGNTVPTLTACFRSELLRKYIEECDPQSKKWLMGDYPLWIYISHKSKIKFDRSIVGVYRVSENSVSHRADPYKAAAFYKSFIDIGYSFAHRFLDAKSIQDLDIPMLYCWRLFRIWARYGIPEYKELARINFKKQKERRTLKACLIRMTLLFPILRSLFVIYDNFLVKSEI